MMTAVLVDAQKPGLSGWHFVRNCSRVQVSGLFGAIVRLYCHDGEGSNFEIYEDGTYPLPEHTIRVKAELLKITEDSRVHVDLE